MGANNFGHLDSLFKYDLIAEGFKDQYLEVEGRNYETEDLKEELKDFIDTHNKNLMFKIELVSGYYEGYQLSINLDTIEDYGIGELGDLRKDLSKTLAIIRLGIKQKYWKLCKLQSWMSPLFTDPGDWRIFVKYFSQHIISEYTYFLDSKEQIATYFKELTL